ncbi:MAG: hypothetical protein JKY19_14535 [Alcanivoracaceae bacterium]|nr:hypothetical protein [Alcanivoracaceae bacterium]
MKVVINDANILIDLVKLDLIDQFIELNFEIHTTDFVLAELNDDQHEIITKISNSLSLNIISTNETSDLESMFILQNNNQGLSIEDCSVWHYGNKLSATILTGDRKLANCARNSGLEVRGIIYIFDQLLKQGKLDFQQAIIKINTLYQINQRLPKKEIDKRVALWKMNKIV